MKEQEGPWEGALVDGERRGRGGWRSKAPKSSDFLTDLPVAIRKEERGDKGVEEGEEVEEERKPGWEKDRCVEEQRGGVDRGSDVDRRPAEEEGRHGREAHHGSPALLPVQMGGGYPHVGNRH